jgi:manganese/iron transport system permease protein
VLVIALIIVPPVTARLLVDRVAGMTAISCALGALGGYLGLAISYELSLQRGVRLASGATIVVVLVLCFLLALATGPGRRALRLRLAGQRAAGATAARRAATGRSKPSRGAG